VVSQSRLCIDITQTDSIYVYNLRCKQIKLKIQSAIVLQLELSNSIHQTACVHSRNVCSAITFQRTDTVHQTGGRNSKRRPTIEHPTFEGEGEVPDGIRAKGVVAGAGQYRGPRESTPRARGWGTGPPCREPAPRLDPAAASGDPAAPGAHCLVSSPVAGTRAGGFCAPPLAPATRGQPHPRLGQEPPRREPAARSPPHQPLRGGGSGDLDLAG